eukprot:CAMPEP_0196587632 /NCGR_PEP_ID=MMETSP1081-20130531/58109_1 /TAXON_ID=36882 /ORGANISM="Pyramimonas amylifera, Strain CCMP720" /LENGTH=384 /DNA_ID=CAMNT_0041909873 /DNA_START=131 /DNA_END=1286 /DNA_ORIENTATION=-
MNDSVEKPSSEQLVDDLTDKNKEDAIEETKEHAEEVEEDKEIRTTEGNEKVDDKIEREDQDDRVEDEKENEKDTIKRKEEKTEDKPGKERMMEKEEKKKETKPDKERKEDKEGKKGRQEKKEGKKDSKSTEPQSTTLHVANLTRNVNTNHLHEIFGVYGKVTHAELAVDRHVNLPKGFAYVEFATRVEAENAKAHMDGGQLDGNIVTCAFILLPKKPSSPSRDKERLPPPPPLPAKDKDFRDRRDDDGIETGTGGTKIGLPPGGKTRLCPHPPDANPRHLAAAESPLHGAVEEVEVVAVALSLRGAAPAPAPRLPPPAAEPPPAPALPSPRLLPPQPAAPLPLPSAPAPQLSPALAHPCAAPALLLPDLLLPAPRAAPVPALRL